MKLKDHPTANDGYLDAGARKAGRVVTGTISTAGNGVLWMICLMVAMLLIYGVVRLGAVWWHLLF